MAAVSVFRLVFIINERRFASFRGRRGLASRGPALTNPDTPRIVSSASGGIYFSNYLPGWSAPFEEFMLSRLIADGI